MHPHPRTRTPATFNRCPTLPGPASAAPINLARFDLVSMRLAVLCAELGSLSAASRQLHCSLSAGSYRLCLLEQALGLPLFMRDHRGLHLTDDGQWFVQEARTILALIERMGTRMRAPAANPQLT